MFKNPVSEAEFTDSQEYTQSLIETYLRLEKDLWNANNELAEIIECLNEVAGEEEKQTGMVKAHGVKETAKLTRRVNVSYPKEREEEHPLKVAMNEYGIDEMVSIVYQEKSKIAKLCRLFEDNSTDGVLNDNVDVVRTFGSVEEFNAARYLYGRRLVKAGKPKIEIVDKK